MLKNFLLLSTLSLLSVSGRELVTRFTDTSEHPCELLTANQTFAPNPRGCALWYYCEEYPDFIGTGRCTDNYHFDLETQSCNTIDFVGCDIDRNLWDVTCDGNSAKKVPHPYSCSEYTVCIEDLQADFSCPGDQHFSPYDQACMDASELSCPVDRRTCEGAISYVPLFQPSSRSCSVYYMCFNDYLQRFECGPGQHFNADNNWCITEEYANCDNSTVLPDMPDIPSELSMDCSLHGNNTRHPHQESCKFWFWCINGGSQLFWCGDGALFDVTTLTCTAEDRAVCANTQTPSTTEDPTTTDPTTPVTTTIVKRTFPEPPVRTDSRD